MFGHGTFFYQPKHALDNFGGANGVSQRCQDLGFQHAWLRVHNKNGAWMTDENLRIADALRRDGISVSVWGWNDGNNVDRDIDNAEKAIDKFEPDAYIADIENGVSGAVWNETRAKKLLRAVKNKLGAKPLIVSSFGYIKAHEPEIMTAVDDIADFFAPQVYWFWFPKSWMLPSNDSELANLPTNNPASYSKVCLTEWGRVVTKPLFLTGQAYWGEASGWTQARAEEKLRDFIGEFEEYDRIVGLNWWNFSDGKAMSSRMANTIKAANLHEKQYAGAYRIGGGQGLSSGGATPTPTPNAPVLKVAVVAAEDLFFRSSPQGGRDDNILGNLDFGFRVEVLSQPTSNGYVSVRTVSDGEAQEGYLHSRYLRDLEAEEVERAISEAVDEWHRFGKGAGQEHHEPYSSYVNEMWTARGFPNLTGRDRDQFWSAAFISFVFENANYSRMKFDIRHSTYIHEAIQNRITLADRDFWGYRLDEARPQVGDLVCQWRVNDTTYDEAENNSRFPSHTDVIVAVRDSSVVTIGGNVSQSVETKTFRLSQSGHLIDERRVFALMKNRKRPESEQLLTL